MQRVDDGDVGAQFQGKTKVSSHRKEHLTWAKHELGAYRAFLGEVQRHPVIIDTCIQNPLIPGTGSVVPCMRASICCATASSSFSYTRPLSPFSRPLPGVNHAPTGPLAYTCLVAMTRDTPPWWCISGDTDADEGGPELLVRRLGHEEDRSNEQRHIQEAFTDLP